MTTTTTNSDPRPVIEQMIERLAKLVEAGTLESIEQARTVYAHPCFSGTCRLDPDTSFNRLEELRAQLLWAEENDPGVLGTEAHTLKVEREKLDAQLSVVTRKLARNKGQTDDVGAKIARHQNLGEVVTIHLGHCPVVYWMPTILSRIKALHLQIPKRPNYA